MPIYNHILLIDDDEADRELFVEMLREVKPKFFCSLAKDGADAFAFLKNAPLIPDLIFLDMNMPRMDGRQFLQIIKDPAAPFRHIPVVMFTTSDRHEAECLRLGASLYLTKPYSIDYYKDILDTVLSLNVQKDADLISQLLKQKRKGGE